MTHTSTELFVTGWVWTLAIGLPVFAVVAISVRHRTRQSVWWRLLACAVLACVIAPSFFGWSNGHNAGGIIIFPAVIVAYVFAGQQQLILPVIVLGLLPICIVSLLLLGIWSAFIRRLRRDA